MFTAQPSRNVLQRAACTFFAAIIVTAALSLGVLAAQSARFGAGYSVTITQLA